MVAVHEPLNAPEARRVDDGRQPTARRSRELDQLAEGRGRREWEQTSALIACTINSNPFRKGSPVSPDQFNPYARRGGATAKKDVTHVPLALLCNMLLAGQGHKPSVPIPQKI